MHQTTQDLVAQVIAFWSANKDAIDRANSRGMTESDLKALREATNALFDVTESLADHLENCRLTLSTQDTSDAQGH